MVAPYRIFGIELSPYSLKTRSYFRYKQIPHEWLVRNAQNAEEFKRHAKLPLVPLVVTPEGEGLQDSTPIIEAMEALHPEPSIHPDDPALAFLSALIEEYGDEWGNKAMFHYRWTYRADQLSAAERIARINLGDAAEEVIEQVRDSIVDRMVPRLAFVGSSETTRDQLEASFRRQLQILELHLAGRPYLFGGRPAFADFGLSCQLHQCSTDPTAGARMRETAPAVLTWCERMLEPKAEGGFESWDSLAPTLEPLLEKEIAGLFLPWSDANSRALAAGKPEFTVELEGQAFTQRPQKYHAKSLAVLRQRYAAVRDRTILDEILEKTSCLAWLR
jgi:glutathione S-transferase